MLQLKRGWIEAAYFRDAHGVDVMARFRDGLSSLEAEGLLNLRTSNASN